MRRLIVIFFLLTFASAEADKQPKWVSVHHILLPYYKLFNEHADTEGKLGEFVLIKFSRLLPDSIVGIAYGMDANVTFVEINANKWNRLSPNQKTYVLLHELAHDILNWEHNNGKDLMVTALPAIVTTEMIQQALEDLKNG